MPGDVLLVVLKTLFILWERFVFSVAAQTVIGLADVRCGGRRGAGTPIAERVQDLLGYSDGVY
jgi:hypothetical protein